MHRGDGGSSDGGQTRRAACPAVRDSGRRRPRRTIAGGLAKPLSTHFRDHPAVIHHAAPPLVALHLTSLSPATGASNVAFAPTIELHFSQPLGFDTPLPTLTPAVPGWWSRVSATTLVFHAAGDFVPLERVSIRVPGGPSGLRSLSGAELAASVVSSFTVADASILRLQQLLAELGYLPVSFDEASPATAGDRSTVAAAPVSGATHESQAALEAEPTEASEINLEPEAGSFSWRYQTVPSQLSSLWTPGQWNVVTEGAVMAFEQDHGLSIDGDAGVDVWQTLLNAVASRSVTTGPYTYLIATESLPETLYVWSGGKVVYHTPINTGVPAAPTVLGTWPVYLRFTSTTMEGTNPDGTHYDDPGVPWVSYFNGGDAVHGFIRAQYGFPQSDGCVELPPANAETVFGYDTYGTLVTITTGELASEFGSSPSTTG